MKINNILFNDFYETHALPLYNFEVAFIFHVPDTGESTENTFNETDLYSSYLSKAVTDIKIPELRTEKITTYLPGFHFAYPSKPTLNGNLTIKFNDTINLTVRQIANYLMEYNYNPRYQLSDMFENLVSTYIAPAHLNDKDSKSYFRLSPKFDIYLRINSPEGELIQKVLYKNCFVKSIGGVDLDYSGEELITTTMTVAYPYFKVLNPDDMDNDYDKLIASNGDNGVGDDADDADTQDSSTTEAPKTEAEPGAVDTKAQPMEQGDEQNTEVPPPPQQDESKPEEGTPDVAPGSTPDNQETNPTPPPPEDETLPGQEAQAEEKPEEAPKEEAPKEQKSEAIANEYAGVDLDRLKKVLGKAEGSKNYVYSNIIADNEEKVINKKFTDAEKERMKNGEHIKDKNGVEYFWDKKKGKFAHYDIATIGKGLTFKNALAKKNVTLIDEHGNKVTKTGAEWDKEFEKAGRDKMPDGNGRDMGGTATTTKWTIDPEQAEDLFNQSLNSYIDDAKRQAKKGGLDWDKLSQEEKLVLVDNDYNGGGGKAAKAAKAMKQAGGIDSYETALQFADTTTNTKDTLRRLDLVYGTNYESQYKRGKK